MRFGLNLLSCRASWASLLDKGSLHPSQPLLAVTAQHLLQEGLGASRWAQRAKCMRVFIIIIIKITEQLIVIKKDKTSEGESTAIMLALCWQERASASASLVLER